LAQEGEGGREGEEGREEGQVLKKMFMSVLCEEGAMRQSKLLYERGEGGREGGREGRKDAKNTVCIFK